MDLISENAFLSWARGRGLAPDERYPPADCLTYVPHRSHDRFWAVPERAGAIPFFASHLLAGLARWDACYLWPRGGTWPDADPSPRAKDAVRAIILGGAGVPAGFAGALRYAADEEDKLVAAVFAQLVFGWCVDDDVFVIPEHGRYFLQTDHHDVVHASFADPADVDPFVRHMADEGYALPDDLPDPTFKRPGWMA